MATTTTNFGWDIPQSTDLVKDGATAIAALGQDIDTALVDLKGGTTGQVLAKASGTDLDFSWVAQDDSNAIQNAIVDAKGDLIAATAADTPARLAVGTNGQILTADSTAATGLAWTTPASGGFVGCKATASSGTSVSNSTWTAIAFNTEAFDTSGFHSTSTNNSRITIPTGKDGKYLFIGTGALVSGTSGRRFMAFYKNGVQQDTSFVEPSGSTVMAAQTSTLFDLVAGDYIELFIFQSTGSTINTDPGYTQFNCQYLGA